MNRLFTKVPILFLLIVSPASALPPQVQALNSELQNSNMVFKYDEINAFIDKNGNIHSIFCGKTGQQRAIYYISLGSKGSLRTAMTKLYDLPMTFTYRNFCFGIDVLNNIHILMYRSTHVNHIEKYVMLNPQADILQEIDMNIYRGKEFKRLKIFQDSLLIAYRFGACNTYYRRPKEFCELFYQKYLGENQFSLKSKQPRIASRRYADSQADFKQLESGKFLVLSVNSDTAESYLYAYQIDLDKNEKYDIGNFNIRKDANIIYVNCNPGIDFGQSSIVEIGDSLLFFIKRPFYSSLQKINADDSLYVFLFDRNGTILSEGEPQIIEAKYKSLSDILPGDLILRKKWESISPYSEKGEGVIFGVFSFRDFPELIIDMGRD